MSKSNFVSVEKPNSLSWMLRKNTLISVTSLITLFVGSITKVNAVDSTFNIPIETQSVPTVSVTPPKMSAPQVYVPPVVKNQGKNSFIDTKSYSNPNPQTSTPTVIIQSRDSGCQTIVSQGNINSCGNQNAKIEQKHQKVTISRNNIPPNPVNRQLNNSRTNYRPTYVATRSNNIANYQPPQPRIYTHADRTKTIIPTDSKTALMFPLSIPSRISSAFGWRIHPITGNQRMHDGTDLAAPMGTPVLASYDGIVATANDLQGYGLTVILRHLDDTQESRYAHLSEIFVKEGEWVEQGKIIGLVGSSGLSTGSHLHFEWRHLTQQGWVATDAGLHLQYALDNLIKSMEIAQKK